jgi:hypothetical protein
MLYGASKGFPAIELLALADSYLWLIQASGVSSSSCFKITIPVPKLPLKMLFIIHHHFKGNTRNLHRRPIVLIQKHRFYIEQRCPIGRSAVSMVNHKSSIVLHKKAVMAPTRLILFKYGPLISTDRPITTW